MQSKQDCTGNKVKFWSTWDMYSDLKHGLIVKLWSQFYPIPCEPTVVDYCKYVRYTVTVTQEDQEEQEKKERLVTISAETVYSRGYKDYLTIDQVIHSQRMKRGTGVEEFTEMCKIPLLDHLGKFKQKDLKINHLFQDPHVSKDKSV